MARFIFKGFEYDMVEADDLTFQEVTDMEIQTGFDMINGKVSIPGMVWISVRRKFPETTWQDLAGEKLLKIEWLEDEKGAERLPPTSNGAVDIRTADAPTEQPDPIGSGSPG